MSTNYTGIATATQAPSAAPGPGVSPTEVLPVDGEPANVASIYQAFKVLADFIAWLTAPFAIAASWAQAVMAFRDAKLNKRFQIDHFGLPNGSYYHWTEAWDENTGFSKSGVLISSNGPWTFDSNATSNFSSVAGPGVFAGACFTNLSRCIILDLDGGAAGNRLQWYRYSTVAFMPETVVTLDFDASPHTVLSVQWDLGFVGASAGGDVGSVSYGCYFSRPDAVGTNWKCISVNGGSPTVVDSGILAGVDTIHHFRIVAVGGSVDDASTARALFFIDGALVANITTAIPVNNSPATQMGVRFGGITTGATAAPRIRVSTMSYAQDTLLTTP